MREPTSTAVFLTALPLECDAVLKHLTNREPQEHEQGTVYEVGTFEGANRIWKVAVAEIGPGNQTAALEAERAIALFRPSVVMFVGVAGGIKDVTLGDVVVATRVYGYESGKEREAAFLPRPEVMNSSYALVQRAKYEARRNDWMAPSKAAFAGCTVFVRPIVAGQKVLASSRGVVASFIRQEYSDAVAVEMEGVGFLTAIHANAADAVVVRGVSDMLDDKEKVDRSGSQQMAATRASAFAFHLLGQYRLGSPANASKPTSTSANAPADEIQSAEANALTVKNILGDARAEADELLVNAFVRTPDYNALVESSDYNFVVGRRGTGKSALFDRLPEALQSKDKIVITLKPKEYESTELWSMLSGPDSTYKTIRNVTRLLWRLQILTTCVDALRDGSYKARKLVANYDDLIAYHEQWKAMFATQDVGRALFILKSFDKDALRDVIRLPSEIVGKFALNSLATAVRSVLTELGAKVVLLYDGLDEGWEADAVSTAILGGLAIAAADFVESKSRIHCLLFIRDNMFRALAHLDNDYARHIEGSTLRLLWTEDSLLHLVAERLRITFNWSDSKDARIWNRFAHRNLHERDGFRQCLKYTLYRPRDVLVLLNTAYSIAVREGRQNLIESDVERSARVISTGRLEDLIKEYEGVLPGVRFLVELFRGGVAKRTIEGLAALLNAGMEVVKGSQSGSSTFAVLGNGDEAASALYSIGFIGLWLDKTGRYVFCHDGSDRDFQSFARDTPIIIHPCYWNGLAVSSEGVDEDVIIDIHDDYEPAQEKEVGRRALKDQRTRLLGQIHEDLRSIVLGPSGREQFESWVRSAIHILLAGKLVSPVLVPSRVDTHGRDITVKNIAKKGLWQNIRLEFDAPTLVWRIANTNASRKEHISRALFYDPRETGRLQILITRSPAEALSDDERRAVREVFESSGIVVLVVPAEIIARCLRKARNAERLDYIEEILAKRVKTFKRSYLGIK